MPKGLTAAPGFLFGGWVCSLKARCAPATTKATPRKNIFVGCIPGYWSGRTEHDDTAEDGMISTMYTDPRSTRRDEAHAVAFVERSIPAGQFGFLRRPMGDAQYPQVWATGMPPVWNKPEAKLTDGSFSAICRVPGCGVMTPAEWATLCGKEMQPATPGYPINENGTFGPNAKRIM